LEVIRLRIRIQEFFEAFLTLRDGSFSHNLAYIFRGSDRILMKIYILGQGRPH